MASELERRIRGLLNTWAPVCPFRASLKLVIDDVKRLLMLMEGSDNMWSHRKLIPSVAKQKVILLMLKKRMTD